MYARALLADRQVAAREFIFSARSPRERLSVVPFFFLLPRSSAFFFLSFFSSLASPVFAIPKIEGIEEPTGRPRRLAVRLPARSEPRQRALRRELAAEEVGGGGASLRELVVVVLLVLVVVEMAEHNERKERAARPMEIPTAAIAMEMLSGSSTRRRYVVSYRREHRRHHRHPRRTRILLPSANDVS